MNAMTNNKIKLPDGEDTIRPVYTMGYPIILVRRAL
jgi:hypothetical protein